MADNLPSLPLTTLRQAYYELGRRVDIALHTQIGDHARLNEQKNEVMRLVASIEQVHTLMITFPSNTHLLL